MKTVQALIVIRRTFTVYLKSKHSSSVLRPHCHAGYTARQTRIIPGYTGNYTLLRSKAPRHSALRPTSEIRDHGNLFQRQQQAGVTVIYGLRSFCGEQHADRPSTRYVKSVKIIVQIYFVPETYFATTLQCTVYSNYTDIVLLMKSFGLF